MKCTPLNIAVFFVTGIALFLLIVGMATDKMGMIVHNGQVKQIIGMFANTDFKASEGGWSQSLIFFQTEA